MTARDAVQGEVWDVDLGATEGHEHAGYHPCVVISIEWLGAGPSGMCIVVPCTGTDRGIKLHLKIDPPAGGFTKPTYALPEQVRAISRRRLHKRRGALSDATTTELIRRVRILIRPPSGS